ncbi:MAG: PDZ domain-containing protein [Bryobacterales bacterium]
MKSLALSSIFSLVLAVAPLALAQPRTSPSPGAPYLGVGVIEVNDSSARRVGLPRPSGVEVAKVAAGSPAEAAGLKPGDVVTRFGNEDVQGVEHFVLLVRETPVGRVVEMDLASSSGKRTVSVEIGERRAVIQAVRPAQQVRIRLSEPMDVDMPRSILVVNSRSIGATLESVDGQFAGVFGVNAGVLVREVAPSGSAAKAGLTPGDVITAVDGRAVQRTSDIRIELSRANAETARLDVMRNKTHKQLEIETGRKTITRPLEGAQQVSRPN